MHKFAWLDFVEAFIDITDAFLSQFKLKLRFKEEGGANQSRTYAAGYGTYKRDGKRYADFLGGRLQVWDSGDSERYWIEMPANWNGLEDT